MDDIERDLAEYVQLLEDYEYEFKRTKFFRMYPPEDRVPNALGKSYEKHIEAIRLTKDKRFVSVCGGNGCITPWTQIETCAGPKEIKDLVGVSEFSVRSHDGKYRRDARGHGVFLKCMDLAYQVTLDNGKSFACTANHRVLTSIGWLKLDEFVWKSSGLVYARGKLPEAAEPAVIRSRIYDPAAITAICADYSDPSDQVGEWWRAAMRQIEPRVVDQFDMGGSLGEWLLEVSDQPALIGGARVVFIAPLGVQPILDLTVDVTHCYESAGVFHHNTGKSLWGAYSDTAHLTGLYPDWWEGHRFQKPIDGMVAGRSWGDVQKSIQEYLIGKPDERGTGMIPADLIVGYGPQVANTGCIEHVKVRHVSGGTSYLYFKSYEQPVLSFEMTNRDYIRLDEEPDYKRYAACVQRFRGHTRDGRLLLTFTPEEGATEVVQLFMWEMSNHITKEEFDKSSRAVVVISQYDVPHKTDEEIEIGALNMDPARRAAKIHGQIAFGKGAVYPVEESTYLVEPFEIPASWPRVWICDPGFVDPNAVLWFAHDRENNQWYCYREHYVSNQPVSVHASAIKMSGEWIPGLFDTQANAVGALAGDHTLLEEYRSHWPQEFRKNLDVVSKANIEDSVMVVLEWLVTGRMKIFSTLQNLRRELRSYHRDENYKIVGKNDHALDALRYHITGGGIEAAKQKPIKKATMVRTQDYGVKWQ